MPYVSVHVDASDVLEELDVKDIEAELQRRSKVTAPVGCREVYDQELLEQVFMHYRDKPDVPYCLREYIYRVLGRIL